MKLSSIKIFTALVAVVLFIIFVQNISDKTESKADIVSDWFYLTGYEFRVFFNNNTQLIYDQVGINGMVDVVAAALEEGRIDMFICHSMAHDIGHYAGYVKYFPDIEKNISKRNLDFCGSGFLHGVEAELANYPYPQNVESLKFFCHLAMPYDPFFKGCYHGAGHAFMENEHDVTRALAQCDQLILIETYAPDHDDCYRGVFSENTDQMYKDGVSLSEMLSLCQELDPDYHSVCAKEIHFTNDINGVSNDFFTPLYNDCLDANLSPDIQSGCIEGVASVESEAQFPSGSYSVSPTVYNMSPELQGIYVNTFFGTYYKSRLHGLSVEVSEFCEAFPESLRNSCFQQEQHVLSSITESSSSKDL